MPKTNWPHRNINAICWRFAHELDVDLLDTHLAMAVRSNMPEVTVVRGRAVYDTGKQEPCTWVRLGARDYDVHLIAQRRRCALGCSLSWVGNRQLTVEYVLEGEAFEEAQGAASEHIEALKGWVCPTCPACCGQRRAHTLDAGCPCPWEEKLQDHWERAPSQPYAAYMEGRRLDVGAGKAFRR